MDIEVKPNKWTTENRVGFTNDIYKTFNRSKYPSNVKKENVNVLKENVI